MYVNAQGGLWSVRGDYRAAQEKEIGQLIDGAVSMMSVMSISETVISVYECMYVGRLRIFSY
jgi:hypothetical protein